MNGTEYARVSGSYNTAFIGTYALLSQDKVNAISTIRLYGYFYYGGGTQVVSSSSTFQLNDETIKSGSYTYSPGCHLLGTKDITVQHNDDGSFPATGVSIYADSYHMSGSDSGTISDIENIPRASTVSCSSPYIGDTATITIGKKVSSFTHNVTYHILDYDTLTGTIAENTSETVLSFDTSTLKEQIYALMPNAKSVSATIRCRTYSGDTKIGDTQIANFTLYAKEDECKPLLTLDVTDTNEKATELVGSNEKFIKYISKPNVVMYPTPRYGATIKGHTISLGDGQYYYAESHTFETMASNVVSGTVRDSRGYYTTEETEVEMIDYIKLHIDNIDISRTEDVSSEVLLNVNGVWFNGNFNDENANTLAASFQYKLSDSSEWIDGGTLTPTIDGNTFKFTDVSLGDIYDYNNEYQFKIVLSDLLMTVGSENKEAITLPKGQEVVAIGDDTVWVYGDLLLNGEPVKIEKDTGWQDIVFPDTSIANQHSSFEKCQYRRIGDILYFKGLMNIPTTQSDNDVVFANIPLEECRPSKNRYISVASSSNEVGGGSKPALIVINSAGNIRNHYSYITSWISLDGIVIGL